MASHFEVKSKKSKTLQQKHLQRNIDGCALYCAQTSELEKVLWRSSAFDLDPLAMIYDAAKAVCEQKFDRIVIVQLNIPTEPHSVNRYNLGRPQNTQCITYSWSKQLIT